MFYNSDLFQYHIIFQVFYDSVLKHDTNRVIKRFETATEKGVQIEKRKTDTNHIINHIANRGVCIVLTNANLLGCESCNYYSMTTCSQIGLSASSTKPSTGFLSLCPVTTSYQGHYIVVCGYDLPHQKIVYRNPSVDDRECVMSFQKFKDARSCYGTDDDIIFIDTISSAANVTPSNRQTELYSKL